MPVVFADAGYWIGLLVPDDDLRDRTLAITASLGDTTIITTQMVLIEVFSYVSRRGADARLDAARLWRDIDEDPDVEIIHQTDAQFRAAAELYAARPDQRWSLVDCASFLIMEERNITRALAYDRDFEQAGFVALLREGR